MNERDFGKIPSGACVLNVGEFEVGDNGEKAKTAPVKLVARSGKPIEHWFWGRVVHDMAGMHMHKPRLPIDYVHDSREVIGYLNRFDTESGDLITTGALVPFKDSDRATEIIHKMRAGVPYEASINFGGDGIKVQEVGDGEVAEVNGARFDGPGIIIREWPLRGVAICPYGADSNTESAVLSESKQHFSAAVLPKPKANTKEGEVMSQSVEVKAEAEKPTAEPKVEEVKMEQKPDEAKIEEVKEEEAVEVVKPAEAVATEGIQPVEAAPAVEAQPAEVKVEEAKPELSRDEFVRIANEFGDAIAAKIMRDGGDYGAAQKLAFDAVREENKQLKAAIAESSAQGHGTPVPVVAAPVDGKKNSLFNTGK